MRNLLFISMLCLFLGGYIPAQADALKPFVEEQQTINIIPDIGLNANRCGCGPKKWDKDKSCCNCQYVIPSKELNKGKGFVIDRPGIWCLDGNVEFDPKPSKYSPPDQRAVQAAITVKAGVSNVTVDLGSYRIVQGKAGSSDQTPFVVCILVPDPDPTNPDTDFVGAESIYIKGDNAIIDGFSMFGIRIFAHTADIRLSNLTIKNCGQLASKALRPFPGYLPHDGALPPDYCPLIGNQQFGPGFGVGGISIGEGSSLAMGSQFFVGSPNYQLYNRVNELLLDNVTCFNNFFNGITLNNITDLIVDNCRFDNTYSDEPGYNSSDPANEVGPIPAWGAIIAENFGVNFTSSLSVLNGEIRNTTFNNSIMEGDLTTKININYTSLAASYTVMGSVELRSQNLNYTDCQFNNSYLGFPGVNCGGYLSASCIDSTIENCSFDGHTSVGFVQGFHRSGQCFGVRSSRNTRLINCTANNLTNIGDQQLPTPVIGNNGIVGFVFLYAKDLILDGCVSEDLVINGPASATTRSAGISVQASAGNSTAAVNNVVLRNCVASRVLAMNGGRVTGFTFRNRFAGSDAMKSVVVESCIATGNQTFTPTLTTPGIVQGTAFGFYTEQLLQTTPEALASIPMSFDGCVAMHNKGVPTVFVGSNIAANQYTSGFYVINASAVSFNNCVAIDNVYGFLLQKSDKCTVRRCRADSNVDLQFVPGTGEGFTDLGTPSVPIGKLGTPASPGRSTSLFENNSAYMNGAGTSPVVGVNRNYNVFVDTTATVPLPTLQGVISTSTYTLFNGPAFYSPVYNISTVN